MLKINNITFTLTQVANGDTLLCTDVSPVKEFVDGKSTDKIMGFRYSCVCPANKYEQISIKVEEATPTIAADELAAKGTVKVKPKNFEGRFYRDRNGEYQFTAKATTLEVVG
ncbi:MULTISPECIES: hypothetical protein [Paenibacillus]|uniref:hypothetical protein n=1 Tax=Paenibacillus TaxID=44249 RepID=UPI00096DA03B|nr:hypothetical protein [Paenibacillus odorifer]OME40864.1 hypothetical protein BSK58_15380 [Paenibacillus odorifer]